MNRSETSASSQGKKRKSKGRSSSKKKRKKANDQVCEKNEKKRADSGRKDAAEKEEASSSFSSSGGNSGSSSFASNETPSKVGPRHKHPKRALSESSSSVGGPVQGVAAGAETGNRSTDSGILSSLSSWGSSEEDNVTLS